MSDNPRHINPDELPVWLPGEDRGHEAFEFARNNWYVIRRYALSRGVRIMSIMSKSVAEQVGAAWPAPMCWRVGGVEYGIGSGGPDPSPPLQSDLDANPGNIVVNVMLRPGVGAQISLHLDHGPAGVALAGGDRPPEIDSAAEWLAAIGGYRADIVENALPGLARNYREAQARGCASPVLVTLDLADSGARSVARAFFPEQDHERTYSEALRQGHDRAIFNLAAPAPTVLRVMGSIAYSASRQVQAPPPAGHAWYLLVCDGRTCGLALPLEVLAEAKQGDE